MGDRASLGGYGVQLSGADEPGVSKFGYIRFSSEHGRVFIPSMMWDDVQTFVSLGNHTTFPATSDANHAAQLTIPVPFNLTFPVGQRLRMSFMVIY